MRLLEDDKVIDWAALAMNIPVPVTIESITPESDRVRAGEEIPIRLRLSAAQSTDCRVNVRLMDNYGRLLDEQRFDLAVNRTAERAVRLKTTGALTHLATADCEVFVDGLRSDRRVAEVFVLQPRRWDDYDIVMYRFGPDPIPGIWPAIDRQMRRLNVTTLSSYSLSHSKHANYDVQAQTRISGQESPDGPARNYYTAMKTEVSRNGRQVCTRARVLPGRPGVSRADCRRTQEPDRTMGAVFADVLLRLRGAVADLLWRRRGHLLLPAHDEGLSFVADGRCTAASTG